MSVTSNTNISAKKAIMDRVSLYKNNPMAIRKIVMDYLREVSEGRIDVVDVTSPFAMLTESAAVLTAAFMAENASAIRQQYPSLAQTEDDLYRHMSDKDHIDRFAIPAQTKFQLLIDLKELKSKMVLDPTTGIRKVTIPKNSEFHIADTIFSLQYPIDIKQLSHGGLQIVYDATEESPLQKLTSNVIPWQINSYSVNKQELLYLEFIVNQFQIASYKGELLSSTGYHKKLPYKDQFYYARVYQKNNATGNEWLEMYTTHTDQVYDSHRPTAVLKVYNDHLDVMIPQIYFTNQRVSGSIRIDIYQTKGPLTLILENYKPSAFTANFYMIDKSKITPEIAAFQSIQSVFPYSNKTVVGGRDALSFEQLRQRVIKNTVGSRNVPITNIQIESAIENSGFTIVKNVDVVTNRQFLATQLLPRPFDEKLITAASASIEPITASIDQLKEHGLVKNNGERITLVPEMVYENVNGQVKIVPLGELMAMSSLAPDVQAKMINDRNFLYTPFHYVLDTNNDTFNVRAYYMDQPRTDSTHFVSQNDTTQLQVSTDNHRLVKTPTGYKLYVEVHSNEAYKQLDDSLVHAQLSVVAAGGGTRAFVNGTLLGITDNDERLFEFDIITNFDIDDEDQLWINNFNMLSFGAYSLPVDLSYTFQIYYSTSTNLDSNWRVRAEDNEIGRFLLPARIAFITKEHITLRFGDALHNLWTSSRSIPAASPYLKYDKDILATYAEDIYHRDPITGNIFTVDSTGNLTYNLMHKAGDTIKDEYGNAIFAHRQGDIVLDHLQNPVPMSANTLVRQIDLMFIEGCYYFANDVAAATYRDIITSTIVGWVTDELSELNKQLLEQTKLYYYPKATMGHIRVMTENSSISLIDANQSFALDLFVDEMTYNNESLRKELTVNTTKIIDEHLKGLTVSTSALTSMLKASYGKDVLAFDIEGLGQDKSMQMFTVLNEGERCAIKKKLIAQPDGKLIVVEDVDINFIKHAQS